MSLDEVEFGPYDKAERMARKAFELYEEGKMPEALSQLDVALDINPCNGSWHFNKALTLDAMGKFDDAICEYELALGMNPDDLEILNSLAVDYTRTGQYDLAIETFEHIQQLDGEFEPGYCNRIIAYTEMDQHDMAEQMFYLAQQIQPDCPLCYYNIGNSLFIRGQYKKAVHCWLKTAELEPTHPQIHYRIAQACWSDGDRQRAREHFLAELRTNPGDIDAIFDFGLLLLELGETCSAKEKFNRILELNADFAPAIFYLGEIAFHDSDYEQAIKLFDESLQKDGCLAGPRYRLAQCALVTGRFRQAKAYLASEVKLATENVDVLLSMASMFLAVGDTDFGINCLLRAVEIEPASADTYYWLGLASVQNGRYDEAAEFFSHALDIKADHVCALRASAELYLEMGKLAEAQGRINKALVCAGVDSTGSPQEDSEKTSGNKHPLTAPELSQLKAVRRKIRFAQAAQRIADLVGRFSPRFSSYSNSPTARRARRR